MSWGEIQKAINSEHLTMPLNELALSNLYVQLLTDNSNTVAVEAVFGKSTHLGRELELAFNLNSANLSGITNLASLVASDAAMGEVALSDGAVKAIVTSPTALTAVKADASALGELLDSDYNYNLYSMKSDASSREWLLGDVATATTVVDSGYTLPSVLRSSHCAIIGDYIYLFGGFISAATNKIYRAPVSDPTAWVDTGYTLPSAVLDGSLCIIGEYVYIFGGYTSVASNKILRAPLSNPLLWVDTGATLPTAVYETEAVVIGDYVYIFGGCGPGAVATIWYAPVSNPLSWSAASLTLPAARRYVRGQIMVIGEYVYIFGGHDGSAHTNTIFRAPIERPLEWIITGSTLPSAISRVHMAILQDYIYMFGGGNIIYRSSLSDPLTWSDTGVTLPADSYYSSIVCIGGYAYLLGGYTSAAINKIYKIGVA